MTFAPLPATAAWRHRTARDGFEVAYFRDDGAEVVIEGCTTAVEDGDTWAVNYRIILDGAWRTRSARVSTRRTGGWTTVELETDGRGHWLVDGQPAAALDGCLDVDLEASALTNALPAHRLALDIGARAEAPAAYVHALEPEVTRLEQSYHRIADDGPRRRFDYTAPEFSFACTLVYDESGLVLDYPGIAVRVR